VDFRAVLLEAITLTYESSVFFTQRDPGELLYTLSNGLSFFQQFNKVFSGRGRVSFEYGEEQAGIRESLVCAVSLTAVPFQTLYHSLLFNARDETVAGKRSTSTSVLLYNTAKLYEGIDATLGGGISFQEDDTGQKNTNTQATASASFVPNQKVNLTLSYIGSTTVTSGGELQGETTNFTRAGRPPWGSPLCRPCIFFGSYRIGNPRSLPAGTSELQPQLVPLPRRTLQLTFYYNETIRSDDTKENRSSQPAVVFHAAIVRESFL
jgi:hypothetical protein